MITKNLFLQGVFPFQGGPWSERDDPLTPGQFRTSLPLTVLPQVPVG